MTAASQPNQRISLPVICVALIICLSSIVIGLATAGIGLADPDSMWLLATGRYIFEHHALPAVDPFSYTVAQFGVKPFVIYQWLSELTFYGLYTGLGLTGLLYTCATIVELAFICLPFQRWTKAGSQLGLVLIGLGGIAAYVRYLVRPELLSFLFMSLWLTLMERLRVQTDQSQVNWRLMSGFAILACLWANCHTAFLIGLLLLLIYAVTSSFAKLILRKQADLLNCWTALLVSAVACLFNPWGLGLFAYLPRLFFPAFNQWIDELKPIAVLDSHSIPYYAFFLLVAIGWTALLVEIKSNRLKSLTVDDCYGIVVIILATVSAFACRRMVSMAVLLLVWEWSGFFRRKADTKPFWFIATPRRYSIWYLCLCFSCLFGATAALSMHQPSIPQATGRYHAPLQAIQFLKLNRPSGNVFNEPVFGDYMIWYLTDPSVFIDTRFDVYGDTIVADYKAINAASQGWREAMAKYHIDWVFVSPEARLASELGADKNWQQVFKDTDSVIFTKR